MRDSLANHGCRRNSGWPYVKVLLNASQSLRMFKADPTILDELSLGLIGNALREKVGAKPGTWNEAFSIRLHAPLAHNAAAYRDRLRVYRLPAYAPELNPDEWLWAWLKQHALRGLCPT